MSVTPPSSSRTSGADAAAHGPGPARAVGTTSAPGFHVRRFAAADGGIAALEFALILPVILTVLLGGTQVIAYINATRKVEQIAYSISQMITQATPLANSTTATVNATDLHFSFDAALVIFPYLMKDAARKGVQWWQNITIDYAGIAFTKTSSACSNTADLSSCYLANVVWTSSGTYQIAGTNYRPCLIPQLPADNDAQPDPAYLPRSVYGPASLVVIDVVFTFTPTFGAGFVPPLRIARSAYAQPRYATLINYDTTNNDGIATRCLGY